MSGIERITIDASLFVKLLFANEVEFTEIKNKNNLGRNIQQMSLDEFISSDAGIIFYDSKFTFTRKVKVFENIFVDGDINIANKSKKEILEWIICLKSDFGNVLFKNSKIRGETSAFKFAECSTGNIKMYKSEIGDFEFADCEIAKGADGKIEILDSKTGYFQFRRCKVGNIRIHRMSDTGYFRIEQGSYVEGLDLADSSADYFRIKQDSFIHNFTIRNGSTADLFSLDNSKIVNFAFESGTVRILYFNSSWLNKFSLSGNNKFDIFISECKINWLILTECILSLETSISISDTSVYYLRMEKFAVLGNLFLRNVSPLNKFFKFETKSNEVNEAFDKINQDNAKDLPVKPALLLYHSSLGKTEFTNCDLEKFAFYYSNSNLVDTFIVGGSLPIMDIRIIKDVVPSRENGETIIFADKNETESPYQKASLFNQLKKVLERGGDTYKSSLLQSEWADNQYLHLKLKRRLKPKNTKRFFRWTKYFDQTSQDIYSFWINKKSNNHDENWGLALLWIVGFSVFFYFLFLHAYDKFDRHGEFSWELVGKYFAFLNPLSNHSVFENNRNSSGWTFVIDFVSKLFLGFFIYKFLRAFRKYGKK